MRKILIVGGGQAGLQLALSLLRSGYDVTLMTARTAAELYYGPAVSVQVIYGDMLRTEHEFGLNLWDGAAPPINFFSMHAGGTPGIPAFRWAGHLAAPAQSIDERLKMAMWMELFEKEGGKTIIHAVTSSDLDGLARLFDLVIVAAGRSGLASMFPVDHTRTPSHTALVATPIAYVDEVTPPEDHDVHIADFMPGAGHFVSMPSYAANGRCRLVYLTGSADGLLRDWPRRLSAEQHWDRMLGLLRDHLPRQYEVYKDAGLVDEHSATMDYTLPTVRRPVAELPSGGCVLGMGDTVVTVSTALLQEGNNASSSAQCYLRAILDQGDRPFDRDFMNRAFESYFDYARHFCGELGAVLHDNPAHVFEVYDAATENQVIADRFVNGFSDPADLAAWFPHPETARAYLEQAREHAVR